VLIADDHALFRRGLEMVLEEEDDIDLVGQASDGTEAIAVAGESLPDVVLMDIRMPKISGIEACRATKEVVPSAKIVMLTISDEEEDLFEAIRAGASGYLLKDIPLDEVAGAVRAVHGGQSLINPSMAGKLLTEFATLAKRDTEEERTQHVAPPKLTDREMEVLKLVARGMNNRDIAKELFISENTVKNHVRNILEKLQIHSRMEAVMIAEADRVQLTSGPGQGGRQAGSPPGGLYVVQADVVAADPGRGLAEGLSHGFGRDGAVQRHLAGDQGLAFPGRIGPAGQAPARE